MAIVKRYVMRVQMSDGNVRTFDQRIYDDSEQSMKVYDHAFDRTIGVLKQSDPEAEQVSRQVVETETVL